MDYGKAADWTFDLAMDTARQSDIAMNQLLLRLKLNEEDSRFGDDDFRKILEVYSLKVRTTELLKLTHLFRGTELEKEPLYISSMSAMKGLETKIIDIMKERIS